MSEIRLLFTDNTVPINFSLIGQLPILRQLLNGNGAWTGAVHAECENSVRTGLYPDLGDVLRFIDHCYLADEAEHRQARTIRNDIARPDEPFPKSFGEAETLAVIENRGIPAAFLTDDLGAAQYVASRGLSVTVTTTAELLALAVTVGLLTDDAARDHVLELMRLGRGVSLGDFEAALA